MKAIVVLVFMLPGLAFSQTGKKNFITDTLPGTNCNNVVQNKLPAEAPDRSTSECEQQFDWKVRTAIRSAFINAFKEFPEKDWSFADTAISTLKEVSKESEKLFFHISHQFRIDMRQESAEYRSLSEKNQVLMAELANPKEDSYKKFADFNYKVNSATHIVFHVQVNDMQEDFYFLNGSQYKKLTIPGAAYAISGSRAASETGGGEENSRDGCFIVFGKAKVMTKKEGDGIYSIRVEGSYPKTVSHLTVQQITVRIECNNELLDKLLKKIDFRILAEMIGQ